MIRLLSFITFCYVLCLCEKKTGGTHLENSIDDPDYHKNLNGIITSKGYPLEKHTVQTADGYLLYLPRIPHGRNSNIQRNKKDVILLIHGILDDATCWVFNFPGQSLGFVLPDNGYDVWLINTRGCYYSNKHIKYNTHQREFWNFSFDEIAQYDIPATIDYILNATGEEALYIIGHSQGTTATFAMLSEMPEYNDKVKLFIALAPITTVGYITSPLRLLVPFAYEFYLAVELTTSGNFFPDNNILQTIRAQICGIYFTELCADFIFAVLGKDREQLNQTRLGFYAVQYISSTSGKSILHYAQLVKSKKFRKFDYFLPGNLEHYQQEEPPEYDVSRIRTPVALMWSSNDKLADPTDVSILRRKLTSLVYDYHVPYPYNHADFILALNAPKLISEPVLKLIANGTYSYINV